MAATDSLTLGFMRVLETLQPVERAVFLLHDVFELPFGEVAVAVGPQRAGDTSDRETGADRVRAGRPRLTDEPADVKALSEAFLTAMLDGDIDVLAAMLTDDVVHVSDGGPDHHAARRPVRGPHRVARLFVNITRRNFLPTDEFHTVHVNGQTGTYVVRGGEPYVLTVLGWRGGQVAEVLSIVNRDKLRHFHEAWRRGTS